MRVYQRSIAAFTVLTACLLLTQAASGDHNVAERVSVYPGTQSNAKFLGASADGSHVFFGVQEPVCPGGQYGYIFERSGGTTSLVSTGDDGLPHCVQLYADISDDGTRAFFFSVDRLTSADTDSRVDVYERFAGTTTLVTTGPTDPQTADYPYFAISSDGTRVYFSSTDPLVASDTNTLSDVYERSGGITTLVSARPDGTAGGGSFLGASADGSEVFFSSSIALVPQDTNIYLDIYERVGGTTKLVSDWPHGGGLETPTFDTVSQDGSRIIITTGQPLDPADTDSELDVYQLSSGQRTLLSRGAPGASESQRAFFRGATPDAQSVWFDTADQLTPDDLNTTRDLYERSGGSTTLISTGPTAGSAPANRPVLVGQAANGTQSFFETDQRMTPDDTDSRYDLYKRSGGVTTLISTGPAGGNGSFDVNTYPDISTDGSRVLFVTNESLVPADTDATQDVYEWHDGTTSLISSSPSNSSQPSYLGDITPDGTTVWFDTTDNIGDDTNNQQDVYAARVAPPAGYARPKGASPFVVYLVPAFGQCLTPNDTHGSPLSFPSCHPPATFATQVTTGTPDVNGQPVKSIGWVRLDALAGDPATPGNEADVRMRVSDRDIRKTSDLSDYSGELEATMSVRLTDHDGANSAGNGPATSTLQDFSVHFAVPCTPTADTTIGSTCDANTTANALTPGMVVEQRRSVWQLGQVRLLDGGPDGSAATEDFNLPLAVQGVFVP
jgi:hypothetical protein